MSPSTTCITIFATTNKFAILRIEIYMRMAMENGNISNFRKKRAKMYIM